MTIMLNPDVKVTVKSFTAASQWIERVVSMNMSM